MRRIYTLGETVLDIIFRDNLPVAANPGGSMLNASVTLGRLGVPVYFISEFGNDQVGNMSDKFLCSNGVNTDFCHRYDNGKSAIALAFLDEHQNASYSFYKFYPEKRLNIDIPSITKDDLLMFGSYYGISPEIRDMVLKLLKLAKKSESLIIYDPNFRKSHLHELRQLLPFIMENIKLADIVKGSDEDFMNIFHTSDTETIFGIINDPKKILIQTFGKDGVTFFSETLSFHLAANQINPASTIGAGDNFNAGLAYGIVQKNVNFSNIHEVNQVLWQQILQYGIDFASEVCLSFNNYISEVFAENVRTISNQFLK